MRSCKAECSARLLDELSCSRVALSSTSESSKRFVLSCTSRISSSNCMMRSSRIRTIRRSSCTSASRALRCCDTALTPSVTICTWVLRARSPSSSRSKASRAFRSARSWSDSTLTCSRMRIFSVSLSVRSLFSSSSVLSREPSVARTRSRSDSARRTSSSSRDRRACSCLSFSLAISSCAPTMSPSRFTDVALRRSISTCRRLWRSVSSSWMVVVSCSTVCAWSCLYRSISYP
mmetsp:Transcript_16058/g.37859  ORF Transcript_16058/g.37859 Transcript_16058/m.37859 type:complete len:233 (+) Transcript_16058:973-1671(+)